MAWKPATIMIAASTVIGTRVTMREATRMMASTAIPWITIA
jgi:hypothetical protein